jgi:hypothetical protein
MELNGHELPSTDYWFIVTRADGKEYKTFYVETIISDSSLKLMLLFTNHQ